MTTVEEKMSHFCERTQYWESIDSILVKYLGSEIQDIAYNDQLQVLLSLTDETIVFQYYQENPQEYCLWLIALRTEKFSVEVSYDAVFQWQNKPEDFIKYENALLNILELATPLKIGDSAEYGASIAQRALEDDTILNMYRFKLKTSNRILFCSGWLDVNDLLDAIALKDQYLQTHPEYNDCSVKWEIK